jgi:hypothetical protein
MRIIAIVLNLVQLGYVCHLIYQSGALLDTRLAAFYVLLIAAPVASLVAIKFSNALRLWFSRFLRRKALEEQVKIENLQVTKHH